MYDSKTQKLQIQLHTLRKYNSKYLGYFLIPLNFFFALRSITFEAKYFRESVTIDNGTTLLLRVKIFY